MRPRTRWEHVSTASISPRRRRARCPRPLMPKGGDGDGEGPPRRSGETTMSMRRRGMGHTILKKDIMNMCIFHHLDTIFTNNLILPGFMDSTGGSVARGGSGVQNKLSQPQIRIYGGNRIPVFLQKNKRAAPTIIVFFESSKCPVTGPLRPKFSRSMFLGRYQNFEIFRVG